MRKLLFILAGIGIVLIGTHLIRSRAPIDLPDTDAPTREISNDRPGDTSSDPAPDFGPFGEPAPTSMRTLLETDGTKHSIPLDEIRQGCFGRDCIPSVDDPEFVSVEEANNILPDDTFGIGLDFGGERRFYPFNMLVTREIVNDTVAGTPLVVTYCPLCGTGIVFDRTVDGQVLEFGVSGLLWQSNLLMYNRAESEDDITLWSQVLGEAVVGPLTGTELPIIPSTITFYTEWRDEHPDTIVLNTGRIGDPYNGDYYRVVRSFEPNFDETSSLLTPTEYVFGVEVKGESKAYAREQLPLESITDTVGGEVLTLTKDTLGGLAITNAQGDIIPHVEGFWFSWIAAHPDSELWKP